VGRGVTSNALCRRRPRSARSRPARRRRTTARSPTPGAAELTTEVVHGVEVHDPFRWLEDGDDPAVVAWATEQDARCRAALDALPARPRWHARLTELLRVGQSSMPTLAGGLTFSVDRWGDLDQAVLVARRSPAESPGRVLLDPAALLDDPTATIDWYQPSWGGALVAVGLSTGGSEQSTLRVLRVEDGSLLDDEIPDTRACSLSWEPDDGGFVYTRYPEGDEYHRHVRAHRLGGGDSVVLGPEDLPDPTAWPSVELSRDGRWLLVSLSLGWSRVDLRLLDRWNGDWTTMLEGVEALTSLTFDDRRSRLVGVTTLDADRGRVVAASLDAPRAQDWLTLRGQDLNSRRVLDWALPLASGRVLVRSTVWGVAELWHDDELVALPGVGDLVGADVDRDEDVAVLAFTSFTHPPALLRWTPDRGCEPYGALPGAPDVAVTVERTSYASEDGTEIPLLVVDGASTPACARTILTAYGGFAISSSPAYSALAAAWCEAGGRFVVAGIRGGAEEGEAWHRAGMLDRKQNVFDDFFAAADHLVSTGRTTRDLLALRGGSNGGLLMGAAITQRPDLARAVHCAVPLLDMVRFHRFLIARLWIPEYGDPERPADFAWLHAYSPYHRVVDGTCYPAVLLTTAEHDTRVDPCHARKFAARLQEATSCGDEHRVLLRVESRAGHGVGKPASKQADEAADVLAFVDGELSNARR
jgi:prolyl oligopeptidase